MRNLFARITQYIKDLEDRIIPSIDMTQKDGETVMITWIHERLTPDELYEWAKKNPQDFNDWKTRCPGGFADWKSRFLASEIFQEPHLADKTLPTERQ